MREHVRKLVVAKAKRLFYQFGFRRITMDEIAANLQISKKTLYALFPSKDEIIRAVILEIMMPKMVRMKELMQENVAVTDFFGGVIEVFYALGQEVSEPMMLDMNMMPKLWKEIEDWRLEVLSHIGYVLERGKKMGKIRANLQVDFFLMIFMHILNNIGDPTMLLKPNLKPSELTGQIHSLFLYGIEPSDRLMVVDS